MTSIEAGKIYSGGKEIVVTALCDFSTIIEKQEKEINALKLKIARILKNSSNSGKKPSSDNITKKIKKKGSKRKIGGQPGHPRNERPLFPDRAIDKFHEYVYLHCPECNSICHCSFSTIRKFIRDVLGEKVSRGYLRKIVEKVGDSLEQPYEELLNLLPLETNINRAIRFIVIDRLITQGTRSKKGREPNERLWTVIATCRLQGRSAFNFIFEAVKAHFKGYAAPSLLCDSS